MCAPSQQLFKVVESSSSGGRRNIPGLIAKCWDPAGRALKCSGVSLQTQSCCAPCSQPSTRPRQMWSGALKEIHQIVPACCSVFILGHLYSPEMVRRTIGSEIFCQKCQRLGQMRSRNPPHRHRQQQGRHRLMVQSEGHRGDGATELHLPSSLRRRSRETSGRPPLWFCMPCEEKRRRFNGFCFVYGRQCPWRCITSTEPPGPTLPRRERGRVIF